MGTLSHTPLQLINLGPCACRVCVELKAKKTIERPRMTNIQIIARLIHQYHMGGIDGASERDRTFDLLITNQLLHMLEKVSRS